jgi:hypothetical protein
LSVPIGTANQAVHSSALFVLRSDAVALADISIDALSNATAGAAGLRARAAEFEAVAINTCTAYIEPAIAVCYR